MWLDLYFILEICKKYEIEVCWNKNNSKFIEEYILSYKNELSNKTDLSDEDKIIKKIL